MHWTQTVDGKRRLRRNSKKAWKKRKACVDIADARRRVEIAEARAGLIPSEETDGTKLPGRRKYRLRRNLWPKPKKRIGYIAGSATDELMVLTQIMNLIKSLTDSGLRYLKDRI